MKKVLIALEVLIILLIGGFLVLIYSGWYNVAATSGHYGFVRWVLETTTENSVRAHAEGIEVPPLESLDLQQGLRHFDRMCVMCHGAPGVEASEVGKGILPDPPDLREAVREWTTEELFWIVSNGIKMSGMPAFGPTHKEEEIWAIVAFIRQLPQLTAEEYQALAAKIRQQGGHGHGNGHDHGHGGEMQTPPSALSPSMGEGQEGGYRPPEDPMGLGQGPVPRMNPGPTPLEGGGKTH